MLKQSSRQSRNNALLCCRAHRAFHVASRRMHATLFDTLPDSVSALHAKGWPDHLIARKLRTTPAEVRRDRRRMGLRPRPAASRLTECQLADELERWAAFIWETALKWHRAYPEVDADDLHSEAIMGCLRAADHYDPRRGLKFATYAAHWMRNHLQRHVRKELSGGMVTPDRDRIARIPRTVLPDDCGLDAQIAAREEPDGDVPGEWWDALTAGLTKMEADAVRFRWRDGLDTAEVAVRLGVSARGGRVILERAVEWLRHQGRDLPQ